MLLKKKFIIAGSVRGSVALVLKGMVKELNLELPRTNPDSDRVEDLNQGPPDFKFSTLNYSTMPTLLQVMTNIFMTVLASNLC